LIKNKNHKKGHQKLWDKKKKKRTYQAGQNNKNHRPRNSKKAVSSSENGKEGTRHKVIVPRKGKNQEQEEKDLKI